MDIATHMILGAAVAQLPTKADSNELLTWRQCTAIGAIAGLFPDIDYLLFLFEPLKYIAYWHRGETHSLLLAPLWALLLTLAMQSFYRHKQATLFIFKICLLGILSHTIIDSFTSFGTQWFAPFSREKITWQLLFVLDIYFSLGILITFILMTVWRHKHYRICALAIPLTYLCLVFTLKQIAISQVNNIEKSPTFISKNLIPQPFSPLYWHVLYAKKTGVQQAYLKVSNDLIANNIINLLLGSVNQQAYQLAKQLHWQHYPLLPDNKDWQQEASQVWQHKKFQPFRAFARYPIFYQYQKSLNQTCVYFSDLRYHWPDIVPAFRFGMCRTTQRAWQLYRIKYFTQATTEAIE